jgi:hypothetical protein
LANNISTLGFGGLSLALGMGRASQLDLSGGLEVKINGQGLSSSQCAPVPMRFHNGAEGNEDKNICKRT